MDKKKEDLKNFYNSVASNYKKLVADAKYSVPRWFQSHFPTSLKTKEIVVLDLACGPGNLGEILYDMNENATLYGIDISPEMIEEAKVRKIYSKLFVSDLDESLDKLKLPKLDVVLAFGFLEFIKSPQNLLENVSSLLRKNGVLLCSFELKDELSDFSHKGSKGLKHNTYKLSQIELFLENNNLKILKSESLIGYESTQTQCPYIMILAKKI